MASWKKVLVQGDNATTVELTTTEGVAVLTDSFVFADADDSFITKRDTIADVIGLVAGTNTDTGLTDTAGVLSVDMAIASETPVSTDLVLAWDAANSHFYTATVANVGAAGDNTTYNVSTADTATAGVVNIVLTDSNSTEDSVSIEGETNSGVLVTQASDAITIDIPDATNAVDGIFRSQLSHTSLATATAAVAGKVLGKMGVGGALSDLIVRDEDDFVSADATSLATTESIKSYVDSQVTAADLDFSDGTNTSAVDLDSQVLTISGTANEIETSAVGQTITIGLPDDVTITGNLTVNGTQTILNTETLTVDDDIIVINDNAAAITAQGGFELKTNTTTKSALLWNAAAGTQLTGWVASPSGAGNSLTNYVSVMEFGATASTAPTGDAGGVGAFHFNTTDEALYIRIS